VFASAKVDEISPFLVVHNYNDDNNPPLFHDGLLSLLHGARSMFDGFYVTSLSRAPFQNGRKRLLEAVARHSFIRCRQRDLIWEIIILKTDE